MGGRRTVRKYKGIDVSLFQGNIDWKKVKADGVDFAMIKASQGRTADYDAPFTDPRFHEHRRGAEAAGIYWGAYHYLCARSSIEARQEAEYFVNLMLPHVTEFELWCAVDVEDAATVGKLSYDEITSIVKAFCDIVKAAGLRPMVYANTWWLESKFKAPANVPVWQAHYGRKDHPNAAKLWQYTSEGKVSGIAGDVDMNDGIDIMGDANGDGKVNLSDASLMMKHIAGHNVKIDAGQADFNDDGYVTLSDVAELMKSIAGWKK